MRSAQHLAVRVALLGTVLLAAGCFRPKLASGVFSCAGDAGACPDNFFCDPGSKLCYENGSGGRSGTGGQGGSTATGGQGGSGLTDAGVDRPCLPAVADPNCPASVDAGLCDPVCNNGCNCYEKCSVNTNAALTCNAPHVTAQIPAVGLLAFCSQYQPADPTRQSDNCAPGEICINGSACQPGPRCYQFCRGNSDCQGGASCSRDGGAYQFCDVPPTTCNPLAGAPSTGCPGGFSCYLSQTGSATLCDCQFDRSQSGLTTGVGRPGDQCTRSRDCLAGNVCVLANGFSKTCEPVCLMPADGGTDSCISGCRALTGSTTYGWCNG